MTTPVVKRSKVTCTLPSRLRWLRDLDPHKDVLITYGADHVRRSITRDELSKAAGRFARLLQRAGLHKGDVVANTLPLSVERLITDTGIMMAGGVAVGANAMVTTGERFFSLINRCSCKFIIVTPDFRNTEWTLVSAGLGKRIPHPNGAEESPAEDRSQSMTRAYVSKDAPSITTAFVVKRKEGASTEMPEVPSLMSMMLTSLGDAIEPYSCPDLSPEDKAGIFSSAGSTGRPKLFTRSHQSLMNASMAAAALYHSVLEDTEENRVYFNNNLPSLLAGFHTAFYSIGSTYVALDHMSEPLVTADRQEMHRLYWHAMADSRSACATLITPEVEGMLASDSRGVFKAKMVATGGHPMTLPGLQKLLQIGETVVNHYGSNEMATVSFKVMGSPGDFSKGDCGPPVDRCEVRVVDDDDKELRDESRGHIHIRSDMLVTQFLDVTSLPSNPIVTSDGWFRSGDMGYIRRNSDGHLVLLGRQGDAIKNGPYTIFPSSIEEIIARCPSIKAVAVVPIPDATLHQELCACVVRQAGTGGDSLDEGGVQEFMRSQLADQPSSYTPVPRYVLFFDAFPRTQMYSKLDRKTLTQQACKMLGVSDA